MEALARRRLHQPDSHHGFHQLSAGVWAGRTAGPRAGFPLPSTLLNTELAPTLVVPPFTVSLGGVLSGCTQLPQVELFRDGIDVGLITLTNGSSSWAANGPFGISYPSDPGYPPAIKAVLATPGVGCTNLIPITVSISYQQAFGPAGQLGRGLAFPF